MYREAPFKAFSGGLDLRSQPDSLSEAHALDLLNVQFTERGAVKQRQGYAALGSALTNQPDSIGSWHNTSGTRHILAGNGNRIDALDAAGAAVASGSTTLPTASPHFFQRFGGHPGGGAVANHTYVANGTDNVRRWTGSAWEIHGGAFSFVTTTIDGKFLALQSMDQRLVNARFNGTSAGDTPSTVRFSDPGNPLTWGANNYVDLDPGDGEVIMGICAWRELLFVFKESKFYVFYGNSIDTDGEPVFNYRPVAGNVGLAASKALAVARDGVYFLDRKGVYRTTGQEPQRISDLIEPMFQGGANIYFKSSTLNRSSIAEAAMEVHDERLYLSLPTGSSSTNNRILVYDPADQWWSLFDIPAAALKTFRITNEELLFAYPTGDNHIGRYDPATERLADGSSAITARWRSGWTNYGSGDVKTIRESKLWGSGEMRFTITKDFRDTGGTSQAVTLSAGSDTWGDGTGTDTWGGGTGDDLWGPAGTITPRLVRKASRGTYFSTEFSNSTLNKTFVVHRLAHHLRETRIPSTVEA